MGINKNINLGNINSGGGNIQIGDTQVTNYIDGLSMLLAEYKQQLDEINNLIKSFKPRTALKLLNALENRITNSGANKDDKIQSKILYLKALCKTDLKEYSKEVCALEFIKAYSLNKDDDFLRIRAAIEYLNIDDDEKSIQLADEIIQTDEYNFESWFIKVLTAENFQETFDSVPKVLKNNEDFKLSIVYQLIRLGRIESYQNLKKLNLDYNIDFSKYNELTFFNKGHWFMAVDLAINKLFWSNPINYIAGDIFSSDNSTEIVEIVNLIEKIILTLENTELSDSLNHSKYFLHYFKYILYNKIEDFERMQSVYIILEKPFWYYARILCQVLNHQKRFKESNDILVKYKDSQEELISEYFLFKATILQLLGQNDKIFKVYEEYLDSIPILTKVNVINICNIFFNILYQQNEVEIIEKALAKIISKQFITPEYKLFLETVVKIMCNLEYNLETITSNLNTLKRYNDFDENYKLIIVNSLQKIGELEEAINFLESFVVKSKISSFLRAYILLINEALYDKNLNKEGGYKELLELLKFWRLNNLYPDEVLLGYEHNLYLKLKDFENLILIDEILHKEYPNNEVYLLFFLYSLEKNKLYEKIENISHTIKLKFDSDDIGLQICQILLKNNINTKKGFEILYQLALNQNDSDAREIYFHQALKFPSFLTKYDKVEIGNWVYYKIDDKVLVKLILNQEGLNKDLINKSVGDTFKVKSTFSNKENSIEIIEICHDTLTLYKDILEEVKNPVNELNIQSFQIPETSQNIHQFLIENFGIQGTNENFRKNELLNDYFNYKIGFTEITRGVFEDNNIDAYLMLTQIQSNKFTTIPSILTKNIDDIKNSEFAIDSSTLLLFYNLEKELNFKFKHKFKIAKNLFINLEKYIVEINSEPHSPMSINITEKGIERYDRPENFNIKRIEFLQEIILWINNNCILDNVEEKLDYLLKLQNDDEDIDGSLEILYDSMFISKRSNSLLITSDTTLFLFNETRNLINNTLNPQKYFEFFYPEKCNEAFYRFLLKSNYIGIDINIETLENEFYDFLAKNENYYYSALDNLKFAFNLNPHIIIICVSFLKKIYLNNSLSLDDKNKFAFEVLENSTYGMPENLISVYVGKLKEEFELLGDYKEEVFNQFLRLKN